MRAPPLAPTASTSQRLIRAGDSASRARGSTVHQGQKRDASVGLEMAELDRFLRFSGPM